MAIIICDIDDTLLRAGTSPIEKTVEWINARAGKYTIVLVTGRPTSARSETVSQLKRAGVKYNRLILNPYGTSKTADHKYETAMRLKKTSRVVLAIDNNATMRAAYEKAGVKSIHPSDLSDNMLKTVII